MRSSSSVRGIPTGSISENRLDSAAKVYSALKRELADDEHIGAVGISRFNESFYSDTTPCLAWNLLYEEDQLIWDCEANIEMLLGVYGLEVEVI